MRVSHLTASILICLGVLLSPEPGDAAAPDLLDLLPPNSAVVIVCDDLRDQTREILSSPLVQGIRRLDSFQKWINSDKIEALRKARREIEDVLNVDLATLGNDLLGDSVVLAMVPGPGPGDQDVRGLFLTRAGNRILLDQLIKRINTAEIESGLLQAVDPRTTRSNVKYWHRRFRPGTKSDEWYVIVHENVFAWSNSEAEIQAVAERAMAPLWTFCHARTASITGPTFAQNFFDQGLRGSSVHRTTLEFEWYARSVR